MCIIRFLKVSAITIFLECNFVCVVWQSLQSPNSDNCAGFMSQNRNPILTTVPPVHLPVAFCLMPSKKRSTVISKCQVCSRHFDFIRDILTYWTVPTLAETFAPRGTHHSNWDADWENRYLWALKFPTARLTPCSSSTYHLYINSLYLLHTAVSVNNIVSNDLWMHPSEK